MKSLHRFAILFLAAALNAAHAAEPFPPEGTHAAVQYTIGMGPEADAIAAKMQKALAADPQWVQDYLTKLQLKAGQMLPYHEKLGITRKEYDTLIASFSKIGLERVADATVKVTPTADGMIVELASQGVPFSKLQYSTADDQWTCALGTTTTRKSINQNNPNSPTGVWSGTQWEFSQGVASVATEELKHVRVAMGKDAKDRSIIYLRVIARLPGKGGINYDGLFRWPEE